MVDESFAKRVVKQRDAAILQSLLACFNEHGCFETTLDHVAADVGTGKGTLYRHYRSREDLFEAALRAGIEALIVRCHGIWEAHAPDSDAALGALIGELVSLNHRGDPLSPATLARLCCGCQWLSSNDREKGALEVAFTPLVRGWQAVGLFERTADPSWMAAVTLALVNSFAMPRHGAEEVVARSATGAGSRGPADSADIASRIVSVLRRAFAPASLSTAEVMGR